VKILSKATNETKTAFTFLQRKVDHFLVINILQEGAKKIQEKDHIPGRQIN
jgi:hypothetical protein